MGRNVEDLVKDEKHALAEKAEHAQSGLLLLAIDATASYQA